MESKQMSRKAAQEYVYDYDSAMTVKFHASRTAEKQAAWFLPYLKPDMRLLDCGCGSGSITVGLANAVRPGHVIGVDMSTREIERACERATDKQIPNVHFATGNIYQLDFPDNSFDALFSHNVLEHLPDPLVALQEMRRVLKPGGITGIRDCDYGGLVLAPDNGFWEEFITLWDGDWKRSKDGNSRMGRHLGKLLYEAGFADVRMSASYDVNGDLASRKIWVQGMISMLSKADFVERVTAGKFATLEELESLKKEWLAWQELPEGIMAISHFEAVGRKA